MKIFKLTKSLLTYDDDGTIEGYASKFNGVDSYGDTIEPSAFNSVIKNCSPKMFFNHRSGYSVPIGVWDIIRVDDVGLYVKGRINLELPEGRNVYSALKFGSIDGLSIAIILSDDDYFVDEQGIRHIKNVQELYEISIVTFPADKNARIIDVKSDKENINTIKEFENYLCDIGFSKQEAMTLISIAKKVIANDKRDAIKSDLTEINKRLLTIINKEK